MVREYLRPSAPARYRLTRCSHIVREAGKLAGLGDELRPHMLRHGAGYALINDASQAMGRAAIAAIFLPNRRSISARPRAAISTAWVAKAKTSELNLGRTIWGLRQAADPKSRGATRPLPS